MILDMILSNLITASVFGYAMFLTWFVLIVLATRPKTLPSSKKWTIAMFVVEVLYDLANMTFSFAKAADEFLKAYRAVRKHKRPRVDVTNIESRQNETHFISELETPYR